jgi:hypothetical protein
VSSLAEGGATAELLEDITTGTEGVPAKEVESANNDATVDAVVVVFGAIDIAIGKRQG